ncbi:heme-binding domain-containing protein [Cellulophaga sp. F20128]|uniref:heme-binding domain-containing protein n=1 Tax=Cellulophaga sp. F20128 TaxID=2926413 RepID=UPI001FF3B390|nr:heme-binding domain-containing protein [Cellulophaga sp. F20128]MCK0156141.1 heme-binding domain-containing protein [Cellulophaga sp. F20128]
MKTFKIIVLVILVAFVGIQFVPTERNQSNVVPATDFLIVNAVSTAIKTKLQVSCYDCHSNNTKYPWYIKVQPTAWFLENHVNDGKSELNFNEWDLLSNRRKASKLRSIIKQIESGEMPLDSYTLMHSAAKFSKSEKQDVLQFMTQVKDSL